MERVIEIKTSLVYFTMMSSDVLWTFARSFLQILSSTTCFSKLDFFWWILEKIEEISQISTAKINSNSTLKEVVVRMVWEAF